METTPSDRTDASGGPSCRACGNCSRAKTKCIVGQDGGGKCQRCSRLGKECAFPASIVRKRKSGKRTRVAEMEAKIDGLVTLLQSTQQPSMNSELLRIAPDPCPTHTPHGPPTPSPTDSPYPSVASRPQGGHDKRPPLAPALASGSSNPTMVTHAPAAGTREPCPLFGLRPSPEEAEALLSRFRDMTPCFPFIFLPPATSARDLHRDRPFLYYCIMAVSCRSPRRQLAFGHEIMQYLGERMLVMGEKSLDLLLGILTYAGWYHFNSSVTTQLCVLLQLAMSLVYNLGLNRPRPARSKHQLFEQVILNPYDAMKAPYDRAAEPEPHTLEEQRAFIGSFFLSSVLSTCFPRMEPLRPTRHMDECIRSLNERGECQADRVMACCARLQMIVGQIPLNWGAQYPPGLAPGALYVTALHAQLQALRKDLSADLGQNMIVLLHYHSLEINIFELGVAMPATLTGVYGHEFQRLETLHAGLKAVQAFFDTFLALPGSFARRLSAFTYTQVATSVAFLHKLSTVESTEWNLDYVRQTLDFRDLLDRLIGWFETVERVDRIEESGVRDADDVVARILRRLNRIKAWHELKTTSSSLGLATSTTMPNAESNADGGRVDFLDDAWLDEVLGPWDSQYSADYHDSTWRAAGQA